MKSSSRLHVISRGEYVHSAKIRPVPQMRPTNIPLAVALDTCLQQVFSEMSSMEELHGRSFKAGCCASNIAPLQCSSLPRHWPRWMWCRPSGN